MSKKKWISFAEREQGKKKTRSFLIITIDFAQTIGEIKWYGPFRKYSFFPNDNTVWEIQCLTDITDFINKLMKERKLKSIGSLVPFPENLTL